jgi:hypothetical protein
MNYELGDVWKEAAVTDLNVQKVKLSLTFNGAPLHEGVLGSGGIAPRIL